MTIQSLIAANSERFRNMVVKPNPIAQSVAKRLLMGKARYQAVSAITHVPWEVIAVIHEREASQS